MSKSSQGPESRQAGIIQLRAVCDIEVLEAGEVGEVPGHFITHARDYLEVQACQGCQV